MLKLGVLILCSVYLINGQFTDRTRIPKQSGSDVVEAVVNLIRELNIQNRESKRLI
jgi:hypothetical protein